MPGSNNPMNLIIAIAIGILTLIAVFSVIPVVGGSIDNAMPALDEGSEWNTTTNPDLPSGATMWTQIGPLLVLAVLAMVIGLVIMYFRNAAG